jgi:hypothetical protein
MSDLIAEALEDLFRTRGKLLFPVKAGVRKLTTD